MSWMYGRQSVLTIPAVFDSGGPTNIGGGINHDRLIEEMLSVVQNDQIGITTELISTTGSICATTSWTTSRAGAVVRAIQRRSFTSRVAAFKKLCSLP